MYEICRLLAASSPKVKKARKPAAKAAKIGARVQMFRDGNEYTLVERDTRYKNAWFIANDFDAFGTSRWKCLTKSPPNGVFGR